MIETLGSDHCSARALADSSRVIAPAWRPGSGRAAGPSALARAVAAARASSVTKPWSSRMSPIVRRSRPIRSWERSVMLFPHAAEDVGQRFRRRTSGEAAAKPAALPYRSFFRRGSLTLPREKVSAGSAYRRFARPGGGRFSYFRASARSAGGVSRPSRLPPCTSRLPPFGFTGGALRDRARRGQGGRRPGRAPARRAVGRGEAAPSTGTTRPRRRRSRLSRSTEAARRRPLRVRGDRRASRRASGEQAAKAALDAALHDLQGKLLGLPVWRLLGLPRTGPPTRGRSGSATRTTWRGAQKESQVGSSG